MTEKNRDYPESEGRDDNGSEIPILLSEIGSRISEISKASGKKGFAAKARISESHLYRYISGKSDPTATRLVAMAKAGRVRPGWLLTGELPKSEGQPPLESQDRSRTANSGRKVGEHQGEDYSQAPLAPLREPIEQAYAGREASATAPSERRHLVIPVTLYVRLIDPLKEMTSGEEEREWVINRIAAMLDGLAQGNTDDMLELKEEDLVLAMKLALRMRGICSDRQEEEDDEQARLKEGIDKMPGNSSSGYF